MLCEVCDNVVKLTPRPLRLAFSDGTVVGDDDTYGYDCASCGKRVFYTTDKLDAWVITKGSEFKDGVKRDYGLTLSGLELDILLYLCEVTEAPHYLCVVDGTSRINSHLCSLFGINPKVLSSAINSLWSLRLVMSMKFNDEPLYLINGVKLGITDDVERFRENFFLNDFFKVESKDRLASARRESRLNRLVNDFTDIQEEEMRTKFNNVCALTGKDIPTHVDHVIPVSIGHGGTTLPNMLPIGQRLNSSKGAKNIFEWYKENGDRFEVLPEMFDRAIEYLASLNDMTVNEYRDYVYECHDNPNDISTEVV